MGPITYHLRYAFKLVPKKLDKIITFFHHRGHQKSHTQTFCSFSLFLLSFLSTPFSQFFSLSSIMADAGLQVIDGTQLNAGNFSLPADFSGDIAGDRVLEFADAKASDCLYSLSLPENLKSSALQRLNFEVRGHKFDREQADCLLRDYVAAIADELRGISCFSLLFSCRFNFKFTLSSIQIQIV